MPLSILFPIPAPIEFPADKPNPAFFTTLLKSPVAAPAAIPNPAPIVAPVSLNPFFPTFPTALVIFFNFAEFLTPVPNPLTPFQALCLIVRFPFAIIACFFLASSTLFDSSNILFVPCCSLLLPFIPKSCFCSSVKSSFVICPSASFSSSDSLSILATGFSPSFEFKFASVADGPPLTCEFVLCSFSLSVPSSLLFSSYNAAIP